MKHLLDEYVIPALLVGPGFAVILFVIWLKG
jgi:hypothetical protein